MATVDLVVTDLDGTLWFGDFEETHPDHVRDLARARASRHPGTGGHGPAVTSTRNPLARLGLAPPTVMMNGALAIDLRDRRSVSLPPVHGGGRDEHPGRVSGLPISNRASTWIILASTCSTANGPRPIPITSPSLGSKAERTDLDEIVRSTPVLMFGIMEHVPEPFHNGRAHARRRGRNAPRGLHQVRREHVHGHTDRAVEVEWCARLSAPAPASIRSTFSRSATVRTTWELLDAAGSVRGPGRRTSRPR